MDSDFFSQNMPYGIESTDSGNWIALNRNHKPLQDQFLSFVDRYATPQLRHHLGCVFVGLKGTDLIMMACRPEAINRDPEGKIHQVFFYYDGSNPINTKRSEDWKKYFSRLKLLSKHAVK